MVLFLDVEYIGLGLMMLLIMTIYLKLVLFNRFMKHYNGVALQYKKDPDTV